ncbi:MAG: hypothetical protein HC792_06030, partial [Acaryochloridaceae cyanobacterium CSU_5_19]|nr:hypothetical protein [Acaryochloridaceae cyanobacterium CSU_5_19]
DFAEEGQRGIEPRNPARSLLFHAMASPNVVLDAAGRPLASFPRQEELEKLENYVFGVQPPTLLDLINQAQADFLAIAVFATEYRPGPETVHRRHADLCFSRTGVSRVGTAPPLYLEQQRGFLPFVAEDDYGFRVLPARYAVYLAVQQQGQEDRFGPMNFSFRQRHPELFGGGEKGDSDRNFWVPLHKLFAGTECIQGLDLSLSLTAHHLNEKLRRVHLELQRRGQDTGWGEPDISQPPFQFAEEIAEWMPESEVGPGWLSPIPHEALIAAAFYQGKPLTFAVPPQPANPWAPSYLIESINGFRPAPEYVHVRQRLRQDGSFEDLNDQPDVASAANQGNYSAQHYLDFTGDGWIEANCPELATDIPRNIPAYSIVTAPDFYPNCDQRELLEWWLQRVPRRLRDRIWQTPPLTLSEERLPPLLQLAGADFRAEDETVTAIVCLPLARGTRQRSLRVPRTDRHSYLPDAAAGVFAPGWDVSRDQFEGTAHLAAYGLGSPFPEDAKLCAALSTFWPAVAPDAGRSFSRNFPTVSPMTDTEIKTQPWDGLMGPQLLTQDGQNVVEYASFDHVDYVQTALQGRFSLALTGQVDVQEYMRRVLAMARAYLGANIDPNERNWGVLSFGLVDSTALQLQAAQRQAGQVLSGQVYQVEFFQRGQERPDPRNHRQVFVAVGDRISIYVGSTPALLVNQNDQGWQLVLTL